MLYHNANQPKTYTGAEKKVAINQDLTLDSRHILVEDSSPRNKTATKMSNATRSIRWKRRKNIEYEKNEKCV